MYRIPIYKVSLVRESSIPSESRQIKSSTDIVQMLRDYLDEVDREHFIIVMLDSKNKLIGIHTVSVGSLTSSLVHPREVFKPICLSNAAAVILAHNHPSGDPMPSQEDIAITNRLRRCGEFMGIRILDHIVLGDGTGKHISMLDNGYWEDLKPTN